MRHLHGVARRNTRAVLPGARPRLCRAPRRRACMGTSKKTATERRPSELRVVGRALRKVDATSKVTGATRFADDLFLPRMLYAKLLRSPHPHARIVSIDPSAARSLPGV